MRFDLEYYKNCEQNFVLSYELPSKTKTIELKENGYNISVNNENADEFTELYVNMKYRIIIENQLKALKKGFDSIVEFPNNIKVSSYELAKSLYGELKIDITRWKNKAAYMDCEATDKIVIWFWEILADFNEKYLREFLKFFTGSSVEPISTSEKPIITIVYEKNKKDIHPYTKTCFKRIYISDYTSKEKLRNLLMQSIKLGNTEFTME